MGVGLIYIQYKYMRNYSRNESSERNWEGTKCNHVWKFSFRSEGKLSPFFMARMDVVFDPYQQNYFKSVSKSYRSTTVHRV